MLKAGQLPAPVIKPLRHVDPISSTRVKVDTNTYIQIKCEHPAVKIFFTTDGTKPDPFQSGRTGKSSTHKYIGPFRLQLGSRVLKAIAVSRDKLRESVVSVKYMDVVPDPLTSDEQVAFHTHMIMPANDQSNSDNEEDELDNSDVEFMDQCSKPRRKILEVESRLEGPIRPINYSGTQINVWGMPTPALSGLLSPKQKQPQMGALTEDMIKNLNTPRQPPPAIEPAKDECKSVFAKFSIKRASNRSEILQ
jgi:hypothetical protein